MKNFTYFRPPTAEQAVGLLDGKWGTSELLAGGTDLLDLQKEYIAQPDKVISLSAIAPGGFKGIAGQTGSYVLDAGTPLAEIDANPVLKTDCPALATAAGD